MKEKKKIKRGRGRPRAPKGEKKLVVSFRVSPKVKEEFVALSVSKLKELHSR